MDNIKKIKRPLLSLFLSGLLPGLGQLYNGQIQKGIILVGLNIVINFLLRDPLEQVMENGFNVPGPVLVVFTGYTIAGLVLWIYAMADAKRYAESVNKRNNTVS